VNGQRQWANPKLLDPPKAESLSAKVAPTGLISGTPLRSVLGSSEQARGSVKRLIGTSENKLCKRSLQFLVKEVEL
jgi:hypothetical protein